MGRVPKFDVRFRHIIEPASTNDAIWQLLETPHRVLEDTNLWPTAEDLASGEEEVSISFARWLVGRARDVGGRYEEALSWRPECGPPATPEAQALRWLKLFGPPVLPVGQTCPEFYPAYEALKTEAQEANMPVPEREHAEEERPMFVSARDLMPFPQRRHASLILSERCDGTRVTLFLLAELREMRTIIAGEWLPVDAWFPTGDVCRWVIGDPDTESVVRLIGQARRWWSSLAGKPLDKKAGRPKGTGTWTFEHVLEQLREYKHESGPVPPSRDKFLERIGMVTRTWERQSKEWGYHWDGFKSLVYGPSGGKHSSPGDNPGQ